MNLGLQTYTINRMLTKIDLDNYVSEEWERNLDSKLHLPENWQILIEGIKHGN